MVDADAPEKRPADGSAGGGQWSEPADLSEGAETPPGEPEVDVEASPDGGDSDAAELDAAPRRVEGEPVQVGEPVSVDGKEPPQAGGDGPRPQAAGVAAGIGQDAAGVVEAILFATEKPLPPNKIAQIGQLGSARQARQAIELLNARYQQMGCAFRIAHIAGGFQMQTLPEFGDVLARLLTSRQESRISQPALETLAVIAYRQPVLRANVEAIRGVACGEVIRGLMEKNLVRIVGRAEEIGRPLLYGTTKHFLEVFGLAGLDDLPNAEQLRLPIAKEKPAAESPAGQAPTSEAAAPVAPAAPASPAEAPPAPDEAPAQPNPPAGQ